MIFHRINTGSSQFSTVTIHSKINRRGKLSRMTFICNLFPVNSYKEKNN